MSGETQKAHMEKARADIGFAEALDGFDPSDWAPRAAPARARPSAEAARRSAEATGFVSREPAARAEAGRAGQGASAEQVAAPAPVPAPAPAPPARAATAAAGPAPLPPPVPRSTALPFVPVTPAETALEPRRRRTGRNVQFNLKARPETIDAYCAIADAMGWGLGETLEYAVGLLQREYPAGR